MSNAIQRYMDTLKFAIAILLERVEKVQRLDKSVGRDVNARAGYTLATDLCVRIWRMRESFRV
jgi:hypothetical protein